MPTVEEEVQAALKHFVTEYTYTPTNKETNIQDLLAQQKDKIQEVLADHLKQHDGLRWYICPQQEMTRTTNGEEVVTSPHFHGKTRIMLRPDEFNQQYNMASLLGEFNKEQEAFIKEKQGKDSEAAVPPWVGCPNEESLKEECLTLSTDRRNFVRNPPAGVDFQFDLEVSYPVAMAALAEDPNLEKMRLELVPKVINEETFWRNYFYRVSLIRQANELSSMAEEGGRESEPSSRVNSMEAQPTANPHREESLTVGSSSMDSPSHEFVSDTFHASSSDIEEVREGMKKLGMDPDKRNEEEWEKELEAELQDYEVVADGNGTGRQDANWENQIEEMLETDDLEDLK